MRLELTRRADYAIRAMVVLAASRPGSPTSTGRIAAAASIPARFLPHVMGDLARAGFVRGVVGRAGGYQLTPAGQDASVLDLVDAVDGDTRQRRCVLRGGPCGLADDTCAVHPTFAEAHEALRAVLDATSIAELAPKEAGSVPARAPRMQQTAR